MTAQDGTADEQPDSSDVLDFDVTCRSVAGLRVGHADLSRAIQTRATCRLLQYLGSWLSQKGRRWAKRSGSCWLYILRCVT